MVKKTQVLVIGAGPGGYPAAIRAAQLGKQVTVIERGHAGGVCLNEGCIPSKALIDTAKRWDAIQYPWHRGIVAQEVQFDANLLQEEILKSIVGLRRGVRNLLKTNGCAYMLGEARFDGAHAVTLTGNPDGFERIEFEHCIIATGSRPIELPNFPFDKNVVDSTGALAFTEVPKYLVVIGGGVIGLEIGTAWMKLGARLTVIEMQDQILPGIDPELVAVVERKLKKLGATIYTRSLALGQEFNGLDCTVKFKTHDGVGSTGCKKILVCVGRKPNTDLLNLKVVGVATDTRGFITIDPHCRTSVPHIFAVGDTVPGPMLAHKATNDGEVAAINTIVGKSARQVAVIPSVIFTDPEIAMVGKTAAQVDEETGFTPLVGTFPFSANGRAVASGETDGFCRVVLDASTSYYYLAGVQIVGAHAGDMIGEAAALLHGGHTRASDIIDTVHAHPTFSEALVEAVRVAVGEPLHLPPHKK